MELPLKNALLHPSRRRFMYAAGALCTLPLLGAAARVARPKPLPSRKKIRIAWLPQATCVAPLAAAQALGYFDRFNLDVELVGFDFHNEAFIQAAGDGKVDAAVAMLHNWIAPMAKGLPVKLITPIHGGCVRILGLRSAGITSVTDLKGQRVGVAGGRVGALATMVYSIILLRNGLDPKDLTFVPVENEDFGKAFAAKTITAAGGIDPPLLMLQQQVPDLVELASNTKGPMAGTACCVTVAGPSLWRDDRTVMTVVAVALAQASDWVQQHPTEAAALFAATSKLPQAAVRQALSMNNYHSHHVAGRPNGLLADVTSYAQGMKQLGMLPSTLDAAGFAAEHVDQVICA